MELIGIHEVRRRVNLSRTSIWRLERAGAFPSRRKISPKRVAWLLDEVEDWIRGRTAVPAVGP
jgi:predicted DNA-binding transcriptional regulator AlpA